MFAVDSYFSVFRHIYTSRKSYFSVFKLPVENFCFPVESNVLKNTSSVK